MDKWYDYGDGMGGSVKFARRTVRWFFYPGWGKPENYLVNDTYTTNISAGSVNGTHAEPGPGLREVTDSAGTRLSLSSGDAVMASAAAAGNPGLWYTRLIAREAGIIVKSAIIAPSSGQFNWGLWTAKSSFNTDSGFQVQSASIVMRTGLGNSAYKYGTGASNTIVTALRANGSFAFVDGYLVGITNSGETTTPLYAGYGTGGSIANGKVQSLIVPPVRWLPTPLASDGFGSTFGTTDGLGHAEGVAGGVGEGGGSVTWTGSTWANSSGTTTNTPTVGSELLTDGGLETWTGATDLTNWTEQIAGTSTVNQEASVIHGGTYAARFAVDASNSVAKISQTIANTNGDWLLVTLWAKASTTGKSIAVDENSGSNVGRTLALTTTYQQFTVLIKSTLTNTDVGVKRLTGGSASLYIDDISVKVLTFASLFASVSVSTADVVATVKITRSAGTFSGLVVALDSASTPANFIIVYIDGNGNVNVDKMVSGTRTNVASTAITYSAGAPLRVIKDDTKVRVYYNDVQVGSELTISDVSVIDNTLHGLFATDAGNTFDNYTLYARGTNGEYAYLDTL